MNVVPAYSQQPAYAPYAAPYAPPRYPLMALASTGQDAMTKPGLMTKEFWQQRVFGVPYWSAAAAAIALAGIGWAWSSGKLDGKKRAGARRDPIAKLLGAGTGSSRDPRRKTRKTAKRRHATRRRRGYSHDL